MTNLEKLHKAWDKADAATRTQFLTFLDQWQAMRREDVEIAKADRVKAELAAIGAD